MTKQNKKQHNRIYVLDTNVLMHDPTALLQFQEHDVFLAMIVLEELDNNKTGPSEVARNARQSSRFLDELLKGATPENIENGISLNINSLADSLNISQAQFGRLFFQTKNYSTDLPQQFPGNKADNNLLSTCLALQQNLSESDVTLVSKDINLRIKAATIGLHAEDYFNDQVLDDVNLLYSGSRELDKSFWDNHGDRMESWVDNGKSYYKITNPDENNWYPSEFLINDHERNNEFIVREYNNNELTIETARNFHASHNTVWGINARNREQNFALNLLMDPEIDFVSLLGIAGTGKTLLTLAAALEQTLEKKLYREIVMTRATIPIGEDIGFLPGTEEEKMAPWMGALMDNLEVLTNSDNSEGNGEWARAATNDLLSKRIKLRSITFMRGRTFLNRFIIIDEAQNLTPKQLKTLVTRAGPGTKVVCLGNVAQIDTPYLTETTSGLTYTVDRFKKWQHSGHVTLKRGERSRLADFAADEL
ncbi:Predicted ATPase related to phosphate starvation-inducible protein PhoH [hydrothermal vent metagenome]|uniref:Predicted ATPase related to phosphate starvation-inducible protein PhoH n=1 Tax=hydrothermal vent metagenome TaxID=652676 RepID=A0A3B1AG52_9ZZZZ